MSSETILYIFIAFIIALGVTVFIYGYRTKYNKNLAWLLGTLRFITLFSILLLLINPKFKTETFSIEKPKMTVLVDNSASVSELDQIENVGTLLRRLKEDEALHSKFDLHFFSFGSDFRNLDTLTFDEKNTNISRALTMSQELFKNDTAPVLLITDGNQTLGTDYEFASAGFKNQIFSVILGDSIKYTDLKIEQLNTNRYAFLKNSFPVEVMMVYSGNGPANSQLVVKQGASVVHRENISFTSENNSKTSTFTLSAAGVGLQKYSAQLLPLSDEKNTVNNTKLFAVEVIDQATNVLVVSKVLHPDLGAIKKSISTNEQRSVTIKKPLEAASILNNYQLILLYQPDRSFLNVYSEIEKLKKNTLVITGTNTDWNFLNRIQTNYNKEFSNQSEDVTGRLNVNYGTFAIEDIGFEDYRPLKTLFGALSVTIPHEVILDQYISGIATETPMLVTMELNGIRNAIWDGEGIWKWRAQSYLDNGNFEEFDTFFGKLVQYLASNKRQSRLEVSSETFYYNNNPIKISAQYFDQNFVFDSRASLVIQLVHTESSKKLSFPLLLKNNFYEVDLNTLQAGEYKYTVSVEGEAVARSGNFTILDFNVEQQFLNANVTKLDRVATNTNGRSFFGTQIPEILKSFNEDNRFQTIQKSEQKVVPLIDWKYLLVFIILSLTFEWFIRKYNGLI
jgi:hypothetical protein